MFHKKNRLAKTKDIQTAFARGRSFFNSLFSVKYVKKVNESARFTVVVSTKVSKNATDRNRLKRIIREVIRLQMETFPGGDYVIMVKPLAQKVEKPQLLIKISELLNSFKK